MSLTIEDLKPKPFNFKVKGVDVECKPPRLSHALAITKIGNIFQNPKDYSKQDIQQAERELDEIIGELIPELREVKLDIGTSMTIITEIMSVIEAPIS